MVGDFALPGTGPLHLLDPRAKLLWLVATVPAFFVFPSPWLPCLYAAGLALIVAALLGPRELGRCLAAVAPLLAIICVLTPVFRRAGSVLWSPFGLPLLTAGGLLESARLVGRFAGLTLAFFAVFRTLEMEDFVLALRWFGLPFRAALPLIVALRFIPTLFLLWRGVQDAHALRRAGGRRVGFFARVLPQLTSVFIQAIRMIPALAMALETRGFGRRNPRTDWRRLPGAARLAASCVVAGIVAAATWSPVLF
jgi:energy-coupling factor transport system permease protein